MASTILQNPSKHGSRIYTLTGSESFSEPEAAQLLSELLHKEVRYVDQTREERAAVLSQFGIPKFVSDVEYCNSDCSFVRLSVCQSVSFL